jgi:hypothetical protein
MQTEIKTLKMESYYPLKGKNYVFQIKIPPYFNCLTSFPGVAGFEIWLAFLNIWYS